MLSKEMKELRDEIIYVLRETGEKLVTMRGKGGLEVSRKQDGSLVSEADMLSDEFIRERLVRLLPGTAYISEEGGLKQEPQGVAEGLSWMVDPLDGTFGYVNGRDEFTINVALLEKRRPILGVICVPMKNEIVQGWIAENGERCLSLIDVDGDRDLLDIGEEGGMEFSELRVACSRSRMGGFLRGVEGVILVKQDAASKFVTLLKGDAEVYLQLGKTRVWDTVAAQIMVENCGGEFWQIDGTDYIIEDCLKTNPPFFAVKTAGMRDLFLEKIENFYERDTLQDSDDRKQ